MTIHLSIALDEATKAKLDALAAQHEEGAEAFVQRTLRERIAEEEAFQSAVEKGLQQLDAGLGVPHDEAARRILSRGRGEG